MIGLLLAFVQVTRSLDQNGDIVLMWPRVEGAAGYSIGACPTTGPCWFWINISAYEYAGFCDFPPEVGGGLCHYTITGAGQSQALRDTIRSERWAIRPCVPPPPPDHPNWTCTYSPEVYELRLECVCNTSPCGGCPANLFPLQ